MVSPAVNRKLRAVSDCLQGQFSLPFLILSREHPAIPHPLRLDHHFIVSMPSPWNPMKSFFKVLNIYLFFSIPPPSQNLYTFTSRFSYCPTCCLAVSSCLPLPSALDTFVRFMTLSTGCRIAARRMVSEGLPPFSLHASFTALPNPRGPISLTFFKSYGWVRIFLEHVGYVLLLTSLTPSAPRKELPPSLCLPKDPDQFLPPLWNLSSLLLLILISPCLNTLSKLKRSIK